MQLLDPEEITKLKIRTDDPELSIIAKYNVLVDLVTSLYVRKDSKKDLLKFSSNPKGKNFFHEILENGLRVDVRGEGNNTNEKALEQQKTFQKAVIKAVENGWKAPKGVGSLLTNESRLADPMMYGQFIYSHKFAQALWPGEVEDSIAGMYPGTFPAWQYHLQRMVVSEDAIKYLSDNI